MKGIEAWMINITKLLHAISMVALGFACKPSRRYGWSQMRGARQTSLCFGFAVSFAGICLSSWYLPITPVITPLMWMLGMITALTGMSIVYLSIEKRCL